jgi:hypothetical protein
MAFLSSRLARRCLATHLVDWVVSQTVSCASVAAQQAPSMYRGKECSKYMAVKYSSREAGSRKSEGYLQP